MNTIQKLLTEIVPGIAQALACRIIQAQPLPFGRCHRSFKHLLNLSNRHHMELITHNLAVLN